MIDFCFWLTWWLLFLSHYKHSECLAEEHRKRFCCCTLAPNSCLCFLMAIKKLLQTVHTVDEPHACHYRSVILIKWKQPPHWQFLELQCPLSGRGVTRPRCRRSWRNCVIGSCQAGGSPLSDVFLCWPRAANLSQGLQGWGMVGAVLRSLHRHCPKDGCRSLGRCKRCSFLITRLWNKQHQLLSVTYFTLRVWGAFVVAGDLSLSLAGSCLHS